MFGLTHIATQGFLHVLEKSVYCNILLQSLNKTSCVRTLCFFCFFLNAKGLLGAKSESKVVKSVSI